MKRIINYLDLNHLGFIELFFTFTFILSGYSISGIPLSPFCWLLLFILSIRHINNWEKKELKPFKWLTIYCLTVYVFKSLFYGGGNFFGFSQQVLSFLCLFTLYGRLDYEKFKGAINLVALISIIGLLWQTVLVIAGGEVHPIQLPGLDMSESRLLGSNRPSSFFMEPAAYSAFMYVPLLISVTEKKYIWCFVLVLSVFLTTSSTGIITSFIILGVYALTQGLKKRYIILIVGVMFVLFYALLNVDLFQTGIDKIVNTDAENNMRLAQGVYVVSTMHPDEYILGAPYTTPYEYCMAGRASEVTFYTNEVYMSTFWLLFLVYGVVGLLLYLNIYLRLVLRNKIVIPLIACLLVTMFSAAYSIGANFVYTSVAMLLIIKEKDKL